jgi:hypothetical protein
MSSTQMATAVAKIVMARAAVARLSLWTMAMAARVQFASVRIDGSQDRGLVATSP